MVQIQIINHHKKSILFAMVTELIFGSQALSMKENGKIIVRTVKEYFGILKVTFILDSSMLIRLMGSEYIFMSMDHGMKVSGSKTCRRVKARRYGSMVPGS